MRTVNDCRKELKCLESEIKESETRIKVLSGYVRDLKGEQKGILFALSTKKEEKDENGE